MHTFEEQQMKTETVVVKNFSIWLLKSIVVSTFREDAEVWLSLNSASQMELPERAKYADTLISSIFSATDIENEFISRLTDSNKSAFRKYKQSIQKRAQNLLLVGLSPNVQHDCFIYMGTQTNVVGDEIYLQSQQTEYEIASASIPESPKIRRKKRKSSKQKRQQHNRTCGICGGLFHRLSDCPKLRRDIPAAAVFKNENSNMVTERNIKSDTNDNRELSLDETDIHIPNISRDDWILDSSGTVYVTHKRELFTTFKSTNNSSLKGFNVKTVVRGMVIFK